MLKIGLYNISIRADSIDSDLSDFMPWEYADAMEMMILSHYTSGIDVTSDEYQEGILTAVNALKNNLR